MSADRKAHDQLSFDLSFRPALGREDFLVSACNQDAVRMLDDWPHWPTHAIVIHGPRGSGKSHLCHVWQDQSKARLLTAACLQNRLTDSDLHPHHAFIIEDIDLWPLTQDTALQEALFHAYNALKSADCSLLITASQPLSHTEITLPDLRSRLLSCPHIAIHSPDDDLLGGLLVKLFRDRQLQIGPDILHYCLGRMERSFEAAHSLVHDVDALSLAEKRRITIPLIRRIFDTHEARQQSDMGF